VNEATANHSTPERPVTPEEITRRRFLEKLCIGLSGVCAAILGIPLVGFVVAPIFRRTTGKWISIGNITDYEVGKTERHDH
jgi:menaquinol-cytochrome c reductase iron-sulfur subunit